MTSQLTTPNTDLVVYTGSDTARRKPVFEPTKSTRSSALTNRRPNFGAPAGRELGKLTEATKGTLALRQAFSSRPVFRSDNAGIEIFCATRYDQSRRLNEFKDDDIEFVPLNWETPRPAIVPIREIRMGQPARTMQSMPRFKSHANKNNFIKAYAVFLNNQAYILEMDKTTLKALELAQRRATQLYKWYTSFERSIDFPANPELLRLIESSTPSTQSLVLYHP